MSKIELGVFLLVVTPSSSCVFKSNPSRLLHAALLRRLELINPELSGQLHDAPASASSIEKPWTVTTVSTSFHLESGYFTFKAGELYQSRITALTADVYQSLQLSFNPDHPLGQEPLVLGETPFNIVIEQCGWDALTTYSSLLTMARPIPDFVLDFKTPTGFRSPTDMKMRPEPFRCLQGYLRKWNAFSGLPMETEQIHNYVKNHVITESTKLDKDSLYFKEYFQNGWTGRVRWKAIDESSFPLRMVNALVNYSFFCGTGMKTTQGMGQTVRIF